MTLNAKIRKTIQIFRENFPSELTALIEQGAGEISALNIVERALKPGDRAPDFTLKDYGYRERRLSDYLKGGPVVVTFYRGAWCPYCNLQLAAYNAHLDEIRAAGATLVAITPESPDGIQIFLDSEAPQDARGMITDAPDFDVLHDVGNMVAAEFGLTFKLPEAHRKLLAMMKMDIEKANGDDSYIFPDPATYIIGCDGTIVWAFVPNNYRKRAEAEDIINQLNQIKSQGEKI